MRTTVIGGDKDRIPYEARKVTDLGCARMRIPDSGNFQKRAIAGT